MSNINSKELLKKYITKAIQGQIGSNEIQIVKTTLMNYSKEEWKGLITAGKELAAEAIEEEMAKNKDVPDHWKTPLKDLFNAYINLFLTICNEEVCYQAMLIERNRGGLSEKQKVIKILLVISQQMDKVVARANLVPVKNQYKTEKILVNKKLKPLINEIKSFYFLSKYQFGGDEKTLTEQAFAKVDKMINILKSLSSEEIKVLRWKINQLGLKLVQNYAPSQIKNSPEVMGLIKSSLNLMEAIGDENLTRDWISIVVRGWEGFRKSGSKEEDLKGGVVNFLKFDPGLETELKNWIVKCAQHLNKITQGGSDSPSLPTSQKEVLFQKLAGELSNSNPNPENSGGEISWSNNLVAKGFGETVKNLGSEKGSKELSMENVMDDLLEGLTKTQTKPKWYQNTWVIVPSLIGAAVVGSLITWLFLRKKEPKREEYREY